MKSKFTAYELKLSYHSSAQLLIDDFRKVNNSKPMNKMFRLIWDLDEFQFRESFYALYFNDRLDAVGYRKIADGRLDSVIVGMLLIMSSALLCKARHIALAHNHPSGTLCPSHANRMLTNKINEAGKLIVILLHDYIILTENNYYSFKNEGDF